jgi:hypothetical protein
MPLMRMERATSRALPTTSDYLLGPTSTAVSATYTVSSAGRGVVTQNGATTGIFYVVSPTQVLLLQGTAVLEPKLVTLSLP